MPDGPPLDVTGRSAAAADYPGAAAGFPIDRGAVTGLLFAGKFIAACFIIVFISFPFASWTVEYEARERHRSEIAREESRTEWEAATDGRRPGRRPGRDVQPGFRRLENGNLVSTYRGPRMEDIVARALGASALVALPAGVALFLLSSAQAQRLSYRLEGTNLRVDAGVFVLVRASVPLDRVTDFRLFQGVLMRFFGIWGLSIQTAGAPVPEAVLVGLRDPHGVRDALVRARDAAAKTARS